MGTAPRRSIPCRHLRTRRAGRPAPRVSQARSSKRSAEPCRPRRLRVVISSIGRTVPGRSARDLGLPARPHALGLVRRVQVDRDGDSGRDEGADDGAPRAEHEPPRSPGAPPRRARRGGGQISRDPPALRPARDHDLDRASDGKAPLPRPDPRVLGQLRLAGVLAGGAAARDQWLPGAGEILDLPRTLHRPADAERGGRCGASCATRHESLLSGSGAPSCSGGGSSPRSIASSPSLRRRKSARPSSSVSLTRTSAAIRSASP